MKPAVTTTLVSIATLLGVSHAVAAPPDAAAALTALANTLAGPIRYPAQPFRLDFTSTLGTSRSPVEIAAELAPVEDRPDHPDRARLAVERQLQSNPQITPATLWYTDPRTWCLEQALRIGTLTIGEADGIRWGWTDLGEHGTISLTKAGVAYPDHHDFHTLYRAVRVELRYIANAGVPEGARDIQAIQSTDRSWSFRLTDPAGNEVTVTGDWSDGTPIVRTSEIRYASRPTAPTQHATLEGTIDHLPGWAARASVLRRDRYTVDIQAHNAARVTAREVATVAAAPDPDELEASGITHHVEDFRTTAWKDDARHAGSLMRTVAFDPGKPSSSIETAGSSRVDARAAGESRSPAHPHPSTQPQPHPKTTPSFVPVAVTVLTVTILLIVGKRVLTSPGHQ